MGVIGRMFGAGFAAAALLASGAAAQDGLRDAALQGGETAAPPPELCEAPSAFAAWVRPASLVAATGRERGPLPAMQMGQAAAVTLSPMQDLQPMVAPGRPGAPLSYAGLMRVSVPVAGTYRFALSGPAWLDVVDRGVSARSVAHGHGPECGPIRKLVDLPLGAGTHVVQLSGAPTPNLTLMAIRVQP